MLVRLFFYLIFASQEKHRLHTNHGMCAGPRCPSIICPFFFLLFFLADGHSRELIGVALAIGEWSGVGVGAMDTLYCCLSLPVGLLVFVLSSCNATCVVEESNGGKNGRRETRSKSSRVGMVEG